MNDSVLSCLLRINRQRIRFLRQTVLIPHQYVGVMHLIVTYIGKRPGSSQDEILTFYTLDKASVARGARRLEDMGHIRREIDPDNRRQYRMFLTETGEEMYALLERAHEEFLQRLSFGVAPEDWQTLASLLKQLEENSYLDLTHP